MGVSLWSTLETRYGRPTSLTHILANPGSHPRLSSWPKWQGSREAGGILGPRTGVSRLPLHFPQALLGIQALLTDAYFQPPGLVFSWPHWGPGLSAGAGREETAGPPPCEHLTLQTPRAQSSAHARARGSSVQGGSVDTGPETSSQAVTSVH